MILWLDAQISPLLANWIEKEFNIQTKAVRELGLRDATDIYIFEQARIVNAIVMPKDIDFKILQDNLGAPPKIIWLTCGNTSNKRLKEILSANLINSLKVLESSDVIVEINGED
jgi:predicted nuclease of predicted toxin-antitoxin system